MISYFCLIYFVIGIAFLLIYRKVLAADKLLALICFYPWNLIAIMVQAFIPEYLVEMFLNTISLFLISNIVQRPEEVINPIIGIRSHRHHHSGSDPPARTGYNGCEFLLSYP